MTARAEDPPPGEPNDEGWDETVLVWNATVAKIRAPAAGQDSDADVEHRADARTLRSLA